MRAYNRKMPSGLSNNDIYEFVAKKIKENNKNKELEISTKLIFANINSVVDNCVSLLVEDNLIDEKNKLVLRFKRSLLARKYSDTINAKMKAEFYSAFISSVHWVNFSFTNKFSINTVFNFKIREEKIYHNLNEITDEVKDKFVLQTKRQIQNQPLKEKITFVNSMIEDAIDSNFITKSNSFKNNIEYLKKIKEHYKDDLPKEEKIIKDVSEKSISKIPVKFYALYHWVLIEMGKESDFERNINDKYIKKDIERFAENRYKLKNGQGFYKAFTDGTIDITKKSLFSKEFGKRYKEKLITISNNNSEIINYLNKYPN